MDTDLHHFIARFIGTVALAVAPVVFTAFVTLPLALNRHPGEVAQIDAPLQHMT